MTANLVDKGIIGKNLPYIWQTGGKMLLVSALGLLAAFGNIYFASHKAMQVGQLLRTMLFAKVLTFSDDVSLMQPAVTLVFSLTNVGIVFLGSRLISGRIMEIGSLLTFMMLSMLFIVIPRASVSAKRINEVLDAENQLQDPVKPVSMPKGPAELEFDQVSFHYAGAEEAALEGINFNLNFPLANVGSYLENSIV
ncbi:ABC transporter ATP-binding protein [Lactobacillus delbrueckii]|uniref:ABC transporter ATP-binding protein n=1 Tax=Lactobacillus delbrueckii TaxID=1584 RepID=UPI0035CF7A01